LVWYIVNCINLNNLELEHILHDLPCILQRQRDQYVQVWKDTLSSQPKLYCYKMFKNAFSYESYLDCINNDKRCKTLTRFRLSSHSLSIETGRYNGITRNERKCVVCTQNVCEPEYHFLLSCPLYKELRNKYNITSSWPNFNVFTNTMSNYSTLSINNVAKFLHEAFILREVKINILAVS